MTKSDALNIAVDCMLRRVKQLAIDANFYEWYHADYSAAVQASAERKQIRDALDILQDKVGQMTFIAE
jgi:hypothetical protein